MDARDLIIGIYVAVISRSAMLPAGEDAVRLPEPAFYTALSEAAAKLGIQLYVFSAACCRADQYSLTGYCCKEGQWTPTRVPLPDIVYDRCFHTSVAAKQVSAAVLEGINKHRKHLLLNGNLPSKLTLHEVLSRDGRIAPYLPPTAACDSGLKALQLIQRHHQGIILKPVSGMQGKGIVRLKRQLLHNGYMAQGRTIRNRPFTKWFSTGEELLDWITSYQRSVKLMVQPYLPLTDTDGNPYDIRVLLQKDETGKWQLTGSAARLGRKGSLTSNLHGGGSARTAKEQLSHYFGKEAAEHILMKLHEISRYAADRIEQSFGRFAELALDFGIEPEGAIWLLEANSKPGRSAFRLNGDQHAEQLSIERPLLYARFLSKRLLPLSVTNESANGRSIWLGKSQSIRPLHVQEVHQ